MKLSLYTFADEAFVPAIAALVNSARRNGFSGNIHIGSPEPLSANFAVLRGACLLACQIGISRLGIIRRYRLFITRITSSK